MIIDRISHEVPFYRTYLKHAALQGVTVVNNPFMWSADDKFFEATLATSLGVASPKTVLLPNKDTCPGSCTPRASEPGLPLDWQTVVDHVGLPCILKDAYGGGWKEVYVCHSLDELLHHYDHSGLLTMIVQEFIEWDEFVRCLAIGRDVVRPIKYDPKSRKYHGTWLALARVARRIVDDSLTLVRALGYDMNSMEWAIRDGVPYAIDFMNPAPDMDIYSLTPAHFEWVVKTWPTWRSAWPRPPRSRPSPAGSSSSRAVRRRSGSADDTGGRRLARAPHQRPVPTSPPAGSPPGWRNAG